MLVFSKIKAKFGGNIKYIASGSAPIDKNILASLKCLLS